MESSISSFFLKILKKSMTIGFLVLSTFHEANSENSKTDTIVELQNILKKISQKDNSPFFENTLLAIKSLYDAKKMIQMIVGDHWSIISEEKKKELTHVFEQYITSNYLKMFKNIQDPSFKYINEKKIGKNYRLVKTSMVIDQSENVEINYLLQKTDNKWRIFDVLLAGSVSEIATKKSEFSKHLENGGVEGLIKALKAITKL